MLNLGCSSSQIALAGINALQTFCIQTVSGQAMQHQDVNLSELTMAVVVCLAC